MARRVLIVDGNWLCQKTYRGKRGFSISAVKGQIDQERELHNIDFTIVLFDKGRSLFRTSVFEGYKGNRDKKGMELTGELELTREFFKSLDDNKEWLTLWQDNTEADDIAGYLVKNIKKDDTQIFLYSIDHDWLQLLEPNRVFQIRYAPSLHRNRIWNSRDASEYFGIDNKKWAFLSAFTGDPSDNVPSTGINSSTALKWLKKYNYSINMVLMNEPRARAKSADILRNWKLTYLSGNCVSLPESDLDSLKQTGLI